MCHHARLIFVFLVEMGVCHVDQAGLEILTSSDLPNCTSQSAGITDMSHHGRLVFYMSYQYYNLSDFLGKSVLHLILWKAWAECSGSRL